MTKFPKVGLDLRPTIEPGIRDEYAHVLKVDYGHNIHFEHVLYQIEETFKPFINNDFEIKDTTNFKFVFDYKSILFV